jgi:L-threonylcarbamoyladenylate synthase
MIITKAKYEENKHFYLDLILKGATFIFPSDTIYGIGCLASNSKAIKKIRKWKQRPTQPFQIYAPSKIWIKENTKLQKKYLDLLPGKYTFITTRKKRDFAKEVNYTKDELGVRMPNHWISDIVRNLKVPIAATSVNVHGEKPMTALKDLNPLFKVDFIIKEGTLNNSPSTMIDARTGECLR